MITTRPGASARQLIAQRSEGSTQIEAEAAALRDPEPWSLELAALDEDLRATATALEPVRDGVLLHALPSPSSVPERWRPSRAAATDVVEGGESIELGDRRLQVLHLPGHSPGSIGLLDDGAAARARVDPRLSFSTGGRF